MYLSECIVSFIQDFDLFVPSSDRDDCVCLNSLNNLRIGQVRQDDHLVSLLLLSDSKLDL